MTGPSFQTAQTGKHYPVQLEPRKFAVISVRPTLSGFAGQQPKAVAAQSTAQPLESHNKVPLVSVSHDDGPLGHLSIIWHHAAGSINGQGLVSLVAAVADSLAAVRVARMVGLHQLSPCILALCARA